MDTSILVEELVDEGKNLLKYLFEYEWKIAAAFWNLDKDSNQWKLYLSIPLLKTEGARSIYLRLTKRIAIISPPISIDVDDIRLISSDNDVVKGIKSILKDENSIGYTKNLFLSGDSNLYGQAICYRLNQIKKIKIEAIIEK